MGFSAHPVNLKPLADGQELNRVAVEEEAFLDALPWQNSGAYTS